jgi:hypothetical protein
VRVPKWVPKGYVFQGAYQTPCTCNRQHQAVRLEWSDGLDRITLLECGHAGHDPNANCYSGMRPSSMVRAEIKGLQSVDWYFLAIGDVPEADLKKILDSA